MKIAVVGATGLVGQMMLKVLAERHFPVSELIPVASEKSKGKNISFHQKDYSVVNLADAVAAKPRLALFSAGSTVSLEWAEKFAETGCYVVDNSSAWRMHPDKKLIVPEINGEFLNRQDRVIANPNCSTIQMAAVLKPLSDHYGLKRVVVSTYQSVTGSGQKGVAQLERERGSEKAENKRPDAYPHPIDLNVLPHIDTFLENGYTKEEMKLVNETRKILNFPELKISATTVRVPVVGGHSESVNIEMEKPFEIPALKTILENTKGIVLQDNPSENLYPMPVTAHGKDEIFVGRLRKDLFQKNTLNCWIVSDNLRKGAATNAVQIAEYLLEKGWIK